MRNRFINKVIVMRYTIISLITTLIMSISLISFSNITEIDSLLLIVNDAPTESKSNIYLSLAKKVRDIDVDSSEYFALLGYNYALAANDNEMTVEHLIILGEIKSIDGDIDKSLLYLHEAEQLCIQEKMYELLAKVKITYGDHYSRYYDYANIIKEYNEALKIIEENKLTQYKSLIYRKIAYFFSLVNDYDNAYRYYKKATKYSNNDSNELLHVSNLISIGNLFYSTNNYDSSIYYYNKALKVAQNSGDTYLIYKAYIPISIFYIEKGNYEIAFSYIDSSIALAKSLNKNHELAKVITNKAHVFSLKGDYNNTLKYNLQALSIRKKFGDNSHVCTSYISIGNNYTELGNYDSAFYYLNKGVKIAKEINRIDFIAYGYNKFVNYYESQRNFKKAIEYIVLESKYQDSILIRKANNQVQFFLSQFNLEKEKKYSQLLKIKKKNNLIIFLIIIIIIAILMMSILITINHFRKKTTKEIEKLSNVIETTSNAVVISENSGNIIYVNNGFLKMGNYINKNEILKKSLYDFLNKQDKNKLRNEILPALQNNGKWVGEINLKMQNGIYLLTDNYCSIVKYTDNNSKFIVNIFTNITDRKIAEKKLKESSDKLKIAVQTRDKMFSIIAHDLTGPFSSILGFSKLLATEYDNYQNEDHIRFSQLIYESSKNTFDLLTNLLHWSKSQLGNIELFTEETNLYNLLSENIEPLKLMIKRKEISLHNDVNRDITVMIDVNTIGVVIRNLLTNAIKFTPRGGAIRITSNSKNDKINIIFSDTGVGIKREGIVYLFDVNKNSSNLGTENEKGTGLGLLLCKEFTELNKGTISVESEFGIGTSFTISLPSR